MPTDDKIFRENVVEMLQGGSAHADLATVLDDFPAALTGQRAGNVPYTPWQLLEHMRFTVSDLLLFSTDPKYVAPSWPDDYWPAKTDAAGLDEWEASVKALKADLAAFEAMVRNSKANLYAKIPWGEGQTLLREIILACQHTSYHLGEMVLMRREFGAWKK